MTIQKLRITINDLVNETDDPEILKSIYVLLKKLLSNSVDDTIIGYGANGSPISVEELIASAQEGEDDIKNGRIMLLNEIKALNRVQ
jgi:hypothetical protein